MPWSNPEDRRAYHKRYYEANKEKWPQRYNKKTPEQKKRAAVTMRNYTLRRNYGINLEDYKRMFQEQNGQCAICKREERFGKGSLHVDHCHKTGAVRKLLCVKCNMALGWYEKFKEAAEEYLK